MTKDEIRLVVFVLLALLVGAGVKTWKRGDTAALPAVATEEKRTGWAQPPYVFKNRAAMEGVASKLEPATSPNAPKP